MPKEKAAAKAAAKATATSAGRENHTLKGCRDVFRKAGWISWRNMAGMFRSASGAWVNLTGNANMPDLAALIPVSGRLMMCECKRPIGGELSLGQRTMLERAASQGAFCVVISDPNTLQAIVSGLTERPEATVQDFDHNGNKRW